MFKSVQSRVINRSGIGENTVFIIGMTFVKRVSAMKAKFTYKEFTLLAGVVVAVIVFLTLWLRPVSDEPDGVSRKLIPAIAKPTAKATIEKVLVMLQDSFQ